MYVKNEICTFTRIFTRHLSNYTVQCVRVQDTFTLSQMRSIIIVEEIAHNNTLYLILETL